MVASTGAVAVPSQGSSYYERDGYYAKDDPEHRRLSAWAGRGAVELGLKGPVATDVFRAVPEGRVLDGSGKRLGRTGKDSEVQHRPRRDLTFSAPNSVSFVGLVGGDACVVDGRDRAVERTFDWFERKVAESGETAVRIVTSGHAMMGGCSSVRVDRMAAAPTLPQSSEDLKQLELEHCCRVPD